jgi:hypothetical protein
MKILRAFALLISLIAMSTVAVAQGQTSLSELLLQMEEGEIVLSFETRPDIYGRGKSISMGDGQSHGERGWERGPCQLLLVFRDGELRRADCRIDREAPPASDPVVDLGLRDPVEVARALLELAAEGQGPALEELILPAAIAKDAVVWPQLLALAKDESRPAKLRGSAIFWLGQEAGKIVTAELEKILDDEDADLEIRGQAIFALSLQPADVSFAALRRVALQSPHPQLRELAIFWLAQQDDPRVLDFLEKIITQ